MDRRKILGALAAAFVFFARLNVLRDAASLVKDKIRLLGARRQEQGWSYVRP